jgi:hypothetical protein
MNGHKCTRCGKEHARCCGQCVSEQTSELKAGEVWLRDAMRMINELTPDVKEKAFDPDWFLLRQHLEVAVEPLNARPTIDRD